MFEIAAYILIFVAVLAVLLLVHEAGHFFVAKAAGVSVPEFGIGLPPRLWGFRRGETLYSVNAIPFGAFVKMVGEEDPSEPRSLAGKRPGIRFLVMAAGPFMNAVLAVLLFSLLFMLPQDVLVGDVVIQEVRHGSPAKEAGVRPGDIIVEANGQTLDSHGDLIYVVNLKLGTTMTWLIERDGQRFPVTVTPRFNPPEGQGTVDVLIGDVVIRGVQPGSPAQNAGIQPSDIIAEVDGQALDNHTHLIYVVNLTPGAQMTWTIQRDDQRFPVQVTPRLNPPAGQGAVGVTLATANSHVESRLNPPWTTDRLGVARMDEVGATPITSNFTIEGRSDPPWSAVRKGFGRAGEVLVLVKNAVHNWTAGGPQPFAGPVGIGHMFVEVGQAEGVSLTDRVLFVIHLAAVLSMVLAFFNILPIPALDGGRIMFVAIEWVRRGKRIPPQKEGLVHMVGFAILITFLLFITFIDVSKLGDNLLGG